MEDLEQTAVLVTSAAQRARVLRALLMTCAGLTAAGSLCALGLAGLGPERATDEPGLLLALGYVASGLSMLGSVAIGFVTGVTALFWLHRTYRAAEQLGCDRLPNTPGGAVFSFFVPFLNLVRPYQAVRALYEHLDPSAIECPEVLPRAADDPSAGYRENAAAPQAPVPTPEASLGLWWALWILTNLSANFLDDSGHPTRADNVVTAVVFALGCAVSWAFARVVAGVDGRLRENHRRQLLAARA